ncbi:uncharacterized protein LOC119615937 [Lucilia sericata]|uniref:uncharacterized protein LOC119615937 n=1 Tax=Lucilia sericata TaxID=13632 RepID=UPI0018A85212|nr:uncharacterized protein LOC119615937 [Lucilia sericata]
MESTAINTQQSGESKLNTTGYEGFTSSRGQLLVGEQKYIIRILKMNGSTMVFLSSAEPECLDEIALAMKMPQDNKIVGTYILGPQIITDSQRMAEKLCKRFGRHFIVSYNVNVDRMTAPLLEKQLSEYIRAHEDQFV